ncbi:MAG: hypothetical protein M3256_25655 [Actinomycetota bacterium]|nr:hypothetical protein [Actinomycetota bacterium]MDQ6949542.1 hypothetical protein [Actinomycetota bacterium]
MTDPSPLILPRSRSASGDRRHPRRSRVGCSSRQVDFLIVSRRDDGTVAASIVDPHGDHLADVKATLRGLADYAEQFGDRYLRSIAKVTGGNLRSLNLLDPKVRDAVRHSRAAR